MEQELVIQGPVKADISFYQAFTTLRNKARINFGIQVLLAALFYFLSYFCKNIGEFDEKLSFNLLLIFIAECLAILPSYNL